MRGMLPAGKRKNFAGLMQEVAVDACGLPSGGGFGFNMVASVALVR